MGTESCSRSSSYQVCDDGSIYTGNVNHPWYYTICDMKCNVVWILNDMLLVSLLVSHYFAWRILHYTVAHLLKSQNQTEKLKVKLKHCELLLLRQLSLNLLQCLFGRWKRDKSNAVVRHPKTGKPVLQFVAIVRRDHGDWAIPGVSVHYSLKSLHDKKVMQ